MQRGSAHRQSLGGLSVPLRYPRIEVPAVVVEPCRVGDLPHLVQRSALELSKGDDDVGDLDARVVDVILHLDWRSGETQNPGERVAQRRVSQMTDVRRLVRVDRRVLDDDLVSRRGGG